MNVYAETSAVLRWLLGNPGGEDVRGVLAAAEHVLASRLTLIEAERAFIRAAVTGDLTEADAQGGVRDLATAAAHWTVVELAPGIGERARQRFPREPVRTLDALHLATALFVTASVGPVQMLTTDRRIVENAPLLGLPLALSA